MSMPVRIPYHAGIGMQDLSYMAACPCGCGREVEWTSRRDEDMLGTEGSTTNAASCNPEPNFTSIPHYPE